MEFSEEMRKSMDFMIKMKPYQTVVSNFPKGKKGEEVIGKYISSVSPDLNIFDDLLKGEFYYKPSGRKARVTARWKKSINDVDILTIEQRYMNKYGKIVYEKVELKVDGATFIGEFLSFLQSENIGELKIGNFKLGMLQDSLKDISSDELSQWIKLIQDGDIDQELVANIIEKGVTNSDVVALGYRKQQLQEFKHLLEDKDYRKEYREEEFKENKGLSKSAKEEKVWQYFFAKNNRIFGYGLDYRYNDIINKEGITNGATAGGHSQEIIDFVLGCKDYTILVELKTPSTNIFRGNQANRSGSRGLSNELIDAISQILEYKTSAQDYLNQPNKKFNHSDNRFFQKTLDPKSILIIGRNNHFNGCNDHETEIKKQTFELFRRDSRNIEIITYDELLERAEFIVGNK